MTRTSPPSAAGDAESLASRLRFRHLRLVEELARTGTIGKAAMALHLSQPAVSKMLQDVELSFGFRLFERSGRGVEPTPRGRMVVRSAGILLAELAQLHLASQEDEGAAPPVRIGAPTAVASGGVLPEVLQRWCQAQPDMALSLHEDTVPRLFEALASGEVDALITSFSAEVFSIDRAVRLMHEPCGSHHYVVIVPYVHPLARRRQVSWSDLGTERWILPEAGQLARQSLESQFLRAGQLPPRPVITSSNPASIVQLVAAGAGVAAAPLRMVRAEADRRRVRILSMADGLRIVPTALVYRAASAHQPWLITLREVARDLGESR